MILDKVNNPQDLKKLNDSELVELCSDIRGAILNRLSKIGGHIGPNLGVVEITTAFHYVFNSPIDKIVFDVSHQCYTHKILTGRKEGFTNDEKFDDVTGFTSRRESPHDIFTVGHTSTAVALAVGLAKGRDLLNKKENIVALVGDGSMSGGECFEGIDNAATLNSNIIIVLNDNDMSIYENHGGLYKHLKELRDSNGKSNNNMFKAMGFDYYYLDDGNDVLKCIDLFKKVKDVNHPVLLHIHTVKGKGFKPAEIDRANYHSGGPFDINTGEYYNNNYRDAYIPISSRIIRDIAKDKKEVIALSAAAPFFFGKDDERKELDNQIMDVGICEQAEIAIASGIAKNGGIPVLSVYSSFIQRSYDQLNQDLCLNDNPVTILVYNGTIGKLSQNRTGSVTHLGIYDIPILSNIPNLVYLSPVFKEEYERMLEYALKENKHPLAIRVPLEIVESGNKDNTDYSITNKYKVTNKGSEVALIGAGNFYHLAIDVKDELSKYGINATLINPIFMSGVDEELLDELNKNHKVVATFEDGSLSGGFGEKVSSFYSTSTMKVLNYGIKKEFVDFKDMNSLIREEHLDKQLAAQDIINLLKN